MQKVLFIINPIAGTGNKERIIKLFDLTLNRDQFDFSIVHTEAAGHARLLAKEAAENGTDIIFAVGGDGTVNEVASSLIHTETALGVIPCGSGNGFARHLKISMVPLRALTLLHNGTFETIDCGLINGTPFFTTCGVGFDAFISMEFSSDNRRGPLVYLEKILTGWTNYEPEEYELQTEHSWMREKAMLITCGNASQWGNEAHITPHASMQDGVIDVTIIEPFSPIEVGPMALQLLNKKITNNRRIKSFKCDRLTIRRKKDGVVHYDGDPSIMDKTLSIECVHSALRVLVPIQAQNKI